MLTTTITLSEVPQLVTIPDTGARLQSVEGLRFNWLAAASTPSSLANPVKDNDVWIGSANTIYVWGIKGQTVTVTK